MDNLNTNKQTIKQAYWLGYLGIIPFFGSGLLLTDIAANQIISAIHSYAAIILTFIGALHWGRAISNNNNEQPSRLLIISIIPSLIAWISFFMQPACAFFTLLIAFLLLLLFDYQQYKNIIWFRRLRTQLTLVVCTSLLFSILIIT